jgi:hypothetical protein
MHLSVKIRVIRGKQKFFAKGKYMCLETAYPYTAARAVV